MSPVKVMIVDDSALVRKILSDLLNQDPDIEVVGTAADGAFALRKLETLKPDVITLDVEMRQMGGLELLQKLMAEQPMPAVMVSAHTQRGAEVTLKALELGAVDFVAKPQAGGAFSLTQVGQQLIEKVKNASRAKLRTPRFASTPPRPVSRPVSQPSSRVVSAIRARWEVIAIGSSTGGTEALKEVLTQLRPDCPGLVCTQHMPEGFTAAFAKRLNSLCEIEVKEAEDGELIQPGRALIAPGHSHLGITRNGSQLKVALDAGPPVNRHRPSVEVLFLSVAQAAGAKAIGIMLTGMGADGAKAMVRLKNSGAHTIAQSEETCVVFGMPREAIALGGVKDIVPLDRIAGRIYSLLPESSTAA